MMAQLIVKGLHTHVPATSLTVLLTEGRDDTVTSVIPFQPVLGANEGNILIVIGTIRVCMHTYLQHH